MFNGKNESSFLSPWKESPGSPPLSSIPLWQQWQPQFLEKPIVPFGRRLDFLLKRHDLGVDGAKINLFFRLRRADIPGDVQVVVVSFDFLHGNPP